MRVAAHAAGAERDADLEPGDVPRQPAERAAGPGAAREDAVAEVGGLPAREGRDADRSVGPGAEHLRRLPRPGPDEVVARGAGRVAFLARQDEPPRRSQRYAAVPAQHDEDVVVDVPVLLDLAPERASPQRFRRGDDAQGGPPRARLSMTLGQREQVVRRVRVDDEQQRRRARVPGEAGGEGPRQLCRRAGVLERDDLPEPGLGDEPVGLREPLCEHRADVPVDEREARGQPLELAPGEDGRLERGRGPHRRRGRLARHQRHLAERRAVADATDLVLDPVAVDDGDVGAAGVDDEDLVRRVALGDHHVARLEAPLLAPSQHGRELVGRHAVEDRGDRGAGALGHPRHRG